MPERGRSRRRDPLTREAIVAAALGVLDRDGLEGFGMRRVGEELDSRLPLLAGFTMDETGFTDAEQPAAAPPPDEIAQMVRGYIESLPADRFPNLTQVGEAFAVSDQDARFELLIDLFVEGLARRASEQDA